MTHHFSVIERTSERPTIERRIRERRSTTETPPLQSPSVVKRMAVLGLTVLLLLSTTGYCKASSDQRGALQKIIPFIERQYAKVADQQIPVLLQNGGDVSGYPYSGIPTSDRWQTSGRKAFTSGFLAGIFWQMCSLGGSNPGHERWKQWAQVAQQGLLPMQFWNTSHDVGFVIFYSFGNGYRISHNASYLEPLRNAALTLSSLYSTTVGCTRSWLNGKSEPRDRFKVIIDNMMNLEVLFWVANQTANSTLYHMAFSHANRTSYEHVRPDGSTWQVVAYNSTDGRVEAKYTVQGRANESTWARGQAWAIYGFTMAYRYARHARFLQTAKRTADFFLRNVPADMVPYWDFDAPRDGGYQPRDTSAAAIAASGMLELAEFLRGEAPDYGGAARKILENLGKYRADGNRSYKIPAILVNGTAHYSIHHFDTALIFGDYYFVEALGRISRLAPGKPPSIST